MADSNCGSCTFRAKYDQRPKSILGRLWRWHIRWCPGWRSYMQSLPENEKAEIERQYNIRK